MGYALVTQTEIGIAYTTKPIILTEDTGIDTPSDPGRKEGDVTGYKKEK